MLTSLFVTQTGHAARQTAEGAMLTEIGKPMLGIESGKNFPARMVGCSSSNDWPLVYAKYTFSGSKNVPMGLDLKSADVRIHSVDRFQSPKLSLCNSTKFPSGSL